MGIGSPTQPFVDFHATSITKLRNQSNEKLRFRFRFLNNSGKIRNFCEIENKHQKISKMSESPELQESRPKRMKMESEAVIGLLDLPSEVLQNIFSRLSHYDVQRNVALVCKRLLEISRLPKLCENVKVNLIMDEHTGETDVLFRIDKILKIFPACKLELSYVQGRKLDGHIYDRLFPIKKLERFASSVKTLSMDFVQSEVRDNFLYDMCELRFKFKNLESLALDLRRPDLLDRDWSESISLFRDFRNHDYMMDHEYLRVKDWSGIQLAPPWIWENFSNLKHLRIKSNWQWRNYNDIVTVRY